MSRTLVTVTFVTVTFVTVTLVTLLSRFLTVTLVTVLSRFLTLTFIFSTGVIYKRRQWARRTHRRTGCVAVVESVHINQIQIEALIQLVDGGRHFPDVLCEGFRAVEVQQQRESLWGYFS